MPNSETGLGMAPYIPKADFVKRHPSTFSQGGGALCLLQEYGHYTDASIKRL